MSSTTNGKDNPNQLSEFIWQDREIIFDGRGNQMDLRRGEVMIDSINSVEDTKGNNGERGSMIVTNLRLLQLLYLLSSHH